MVAKETLLESVWPKEIVEENNLQAQISALRKIFGADRNLITTVFGRGYCFPANLPPQIHAMLATLRANGFDPAYSIFLSDFAAALAQKGQREAADTLLSERLSVLDVSQSLWNLPELMRVQAQIRYSDRPEHVLEYSLALQAALLLAQSQTAKGWIQRIEADVRTLPVG